MTARLTILRFIFYSVFTLFLFAVAPQATFAATCTSVQNGNWSNTAIWSNCGGAVPGPTDQAVVNHSVVINQNVGVLGVDVNGGGKLSFDTASPHTLTINEGGSKRLNVGTSGQGELECRAPATGMNTIRLNSTTQNGAVELFVGSGGVLDIQGTSSDDLDCMISNGGVIFDGTRNGDMRLDDGSETIIRNAVVEYIYQIHVLNVDNSVPGESFEMSGTVVRRGYDGLYLQNSSHAIIGPDMVFRENGRYGAYFYNSHNNALSGPGAYSNTTTAIRLESSNNNTISGFIVRDNGLYGIELAGSSSGNTIENITGYQNSSIGLIIRGSNNVLNSITSYSNGSDGIYLSGSGHVLTNINSYLNGRYGIYFTSVSGVELGAGTIVRDNISAGIKLESSDNNTLQNFDVYGNSGYGVELTDDSDDNVLRNITSYQNTYGFVIRGTNNALDSLTGYNNTYDGVFLRGSQHSLTNISSYSNNRYGIYLYNVTGLALGSGTVVRNNTGVGIKLEGSDNNTLQNFDVYGNSGYGIETTGDSDYNAFKNLRSYQNTYGFVIRGTNNALINTTAHSNITDGVFIRGSELLVYGATLFGNGRYGTYAYVAHESTMRETSVWKQTGSANVYIEGTNNMRVLNNIIFGNPDGVWVRSDSKGGRIYNNIIAYATDDGIDDDNGDTGALDTFYDCNYFYSTNTPVEGGAPGGISIIASLLNFHSEESGTADSDSTTTAIEDDGQAWTTNEWIGYGVLIVGGTGAGQSAGVVANDADTLTVAPAFTSAPNNTSSYIITKFFMSKAPDDGTETPLGQGCQMDFASEPGNVNMGPRLGYVYNNNNGGVGQKYNFMQQAETSNEYSAGDTLTLYGVTEFAGGALGAVYSNYGSFVVLEVTESSVTANDAYNGYFMRMTSGAHHNEYYLITDTEENDPGSDTITILKNSSVGFSSGDEFVVVDRIYNLLSDKAHGSNILFQNAGSESGAITWNTNGPVIISAEKDHDGSADWLYNVYGGSEANYVRLSKSSLFYTPGSVLPIGGSYDDSDPNYYTFGAKPALAYWPFEEGSGMATSDIAGGGYDGALFGDTLWTSEGECKVGMCLLFDGDNDYVTVLNSLSSAIQGAKASTVSSWVKRASVSGTRDVIIDITIDGDDSKFLMEIQADNTLRVGGRAQAGDILQAETTTDGITDTDWHFVVGLVDLENDDIRIFVDGVEQTTEGTPSWTGNTFSSGVGTRQTIGIGASLSEGFSGYIDEVKVYPYARSVEQIYSEFLTGADIAPTLSAPQNVRNPFGADYNTIATINWKWDAVPGATNYYIYVKTPFNPPTFDMAGVSNTTTYVLTTSNPLNGSPPLEADTAYTIKVIAQDMVNNDWGFASQEAAAATSADPPINLNAVNQSDLSSIRFYWESGGSDSGYFARIKDDATRNSGWMPLRFYDGSFSGSFGYTPLNFGNVIPYKALMESNYDLVAYKRGEDVQENVYEHINPYQGTIELWIKPNFDSNDSNIRYLFDSNSINIWWDGTTSRWKTRVNGALLSLGDVFPSSTWKYIRVMWETQGADMLEFEVDGAAVQSTNNQGISAPRDVFYVGRDRALSRGFAGLISMRILNEARSSEFQAGLGSSQTFTATPETTFLAQFSADDTIASYWHQGQRVINSDPVSVTVNSVIGKRAWEDNDKVLIYDETGFGAYGFIKGNPDTSGTSLLVDDGASGNIANLEYVGRFLRFDGIDDSVVIPQSLQFNLPRFSIDGWFKTNQWSSLGTIIQKGATEANRNFWIGIWRSGLAGHNGGTLVFRTSTGGGAGWAADIDSVDFVADNAWHHFAVVLDGPIGARMYIDGVLKSTEAPIPSTDVPGSPITIGNDPTALAYTFQGELSELRMNAIALTASDVFYLATHPKASFSDIEDNTSLQTYTAITTADVSAGIDVEVPVNISSIFKKSDRVRIKGGVNEENVIIKATTTSSVILDIASSYSSGATITHADTLFAHSYYTGSVNDFSPYKHNGVLNGTAYVREAYISKNLIIDPNMEQGGIGAWKSTLDSIEKTSSAALYDTRSLIISYNAVGEYLRQTIPVAQNENYLFSVWVVEDGDPGKIEILRGSDESVMVSIPTSGGPAQYETVLRIPSGETSVHAQFGSVGSGGAVRTSRIDRVELIENMVNNGSLEEPNVSNIPSGWSIDSALPITQETGFTGANAVGINGITNYADSVYQPIQYEVGKKYTFRMRVKRTAGAGKPKVNLGGTLDSMWFNGRERTYPGAMVNDVWYLWTFTAWPQNASGGRNLFLAVDAAGTKIVYDDISVIVLDQTDAYLSEPSEYRESFGKDHKLKVGGSILVDGGDTFIFDVTNVPFNPAGGTLGMWIRPQMLNVERALFSAYNSSTDYLTLGINTANQPYVAFRKIASTGSVVGTTALNSTATWYHIMATWIASGNVRLYVNGEEQGVAVSYEQIGIPVSFEVGSEDGFKQAQAYIDDVYVFTRTLTDLERANVLNNNWREWTAQDLSCGVTYTLELRAANRDGDPTDWVTGSGVTAGCPRICNDANDCLTGEICLDNLCVPENQCNQ